MHQSLDVLIITAAEGEDDAVRQVEEGAVGPWEETDGSEGYGFKVWFRSYRTEDGNTLRVALTRAHDMGTDASGNAAARLADAYNPGCLAMCGVCAGRPDWTRLGDVIIAERVYRYDVGEQEKTEAEGKTRFYKDTLTYQIKPQWKQRAQSFQLPDNADWLAARPRPREMQADWLLHEIYRDRDPHDAADINEKCRDWTEVTRDLQKKGWLRLVKGKPALTKAGTSHLEKVLFEHKDQLPEPRPWKIHIEPMGTGACLVRSVDIWEQLKQTQRFVAGLDMEASVIGLTAHVLDIPYIVVKGVMDYAEPERNYGFRPFAARAAAYEWPRYLMVFYRE